MKTIFIVLTLAIIQSDTASRVCRPIMGMLSELQKCGHFNVKGQAQSSLLFMHPFPGCRVSKATILAFARTSIFASQVGLKKIGFDR